MYNYYVTPFFYHGFHTRINYVKKNLNLKFNFFHNFILSNFALIQQLFFFQMKIFPKVINIHLYTNKKKQIKKKSLHIT
jgi:hypothetical protein